MGLADDLELLVETARAAEGAAAISAQRVAALEAEVAALKERITKLEGPPPSSLPLVPFTFPPLVLNTGSWSDDGTGSHSVSGGVLVARVRQSRQTTGRVVRRDFGLLALGTAANFVREPRGRLREYQLQVSLPANYNPAIGMCNFLQWHTHEARMPPYLAFFGWETGTRWRHILPSGEKRDHAVMDFQLGHTYSLRVQAIWSQGDDGLLRVWQDGKQVLDYRGPTYRKDEAQAPYLLFGPYGPNAQEAFDNSVSFHGLRVGDG